MARSATRISDIQENVWTHAIVLATAGVILMIVFGVLFYFSDFFLKQGFLPGILYQVWNMMAAVGEIVGLGLVITAVARGVKAKTLPKQTFSCPYCDQPNHFAEPPTMDFDCEHCDRTVHFQDGEMIPVRAIICGVCRAEHRVAVNLVQFVCDSCNRPLKLKPDPRFRPAEVHEIGPTDAMLQNYDVLVIGFDHRKENEVAFKVQNLLVTNLNEAKRLLSTASSRTPLIVGYDLSQRKADSVKRQLQELGATVLLRPTTSARAPQKR